MITLVIFWWSNVMLFGNAHGISTTGKIYVIVFSIILPIAIFLSAMEKFSIAMGKTIESASRQSYSEASEGCLSGLFQLLMLKSKLIFNPILYLACVIMYFNEVAMFQSLQAGYISGNESNLNGVIWSSIFYALCWVSILKPYVSK